MKNAPDPISPLPDGTAAGDAAQPKRSNDVTPVSAGTGLAELPTRQRLFELLDALRVEVDGPLPETRQNRRWAVQAPVLLGTATPRTGMTAEASAGEWGLAAGFERFCHGWITDLSEEGVGLLTEQRLEIGRALDISLQALLNRPVIIPIRVVYVRQILAHTYRIGAQLAL
ncbi:MAG: hypothetical protein WD009_06355 [Phycisphaeraceae bacterium]